MICLTVSMTTYGVFCFDKQILDLMVTDTVPWRRKGNWYLCYFLQAHLFAVTFLLQNLSIESVITRLRGVHNLYSFRL
jgi:hypothetical protein